jgi:hypothetical protein
MAPFHQADKHANSESAADDAQRMAPSAGLDLGKQGVCLVLCGRRDVLADAGRRFADLRPHGLGERGHGVLQIGDVGAKPAQISRDIVARGGASLGDVLLRPLHIVANAAARGFRMLAGAMASTTDIVTSPFDRRSQMASKLPYL